jgi:hypothetical protein
MNNYILSWDNKDTDADTLRVRIVALILSIDDEAEITQPLWSCIKIRSERSYDYLINKLDEAEIGRFVYVTFSQIAEDDENLLHGEVPKEDVNDSLTKEGGIIDQARKLNSKIRLKKFIKKTLREEF